MAGVFEPVSSKVTASLFLKAARLEPLNQFETLVFHVFAEPSPRQVRFAGSGADTVEIVTPISAPLKAAALAGGAIGVTQTVTATLRL